MNTRYVLEELLITYVDSLYYYELASKTYECIKPSPFHIFNLVMNLMNVPSDRELHALGYICPEGSYWTRPKLIGKFHMDYINNTDNLDFIVEYLDFLETFSVNYNKDPNIAKA